MKKLLTLPFLVVCFALGIVGCGSSESETVILRLIHLLPGGGVVNIDVEEDDPLGANDRLSFDGVTYLESTGYFTIDDAVDFVSFKVERAATGERIVDETELLRKNRYTAYVAGTTANAFIFTTQDSFSEPNDTFGFIRILHGAPSAPSVDVYIEPSNEPSLPLTPTLVNLEYTEASDYIELPAGAYRVTVTPTGITDAVINTTITIQTRDVLTAIAADSSTGGDPFGLKIYSDR
jgi:Domain of unknown function (DUF4397)